MKRRPAFRFELPLFSRRAALKAGGAGLVGMTVLPACDSLQLPAVDLIRELDPISTNELFYVQSAFGTPDVDGATHQMSVRSLGTEQVAIDRDFVEGLEGREREHTLQCIGSSPRLRLIGNAIWTGLPFIEVLEAAGFEVPDSAVEILFRSSDDYHTSIPVSDLYGTDGREPMWLAWMMNGERVPRAHGEPFRFLVPGRYGTKNPKWPTVVDFIDTPHIGHWEDRGWSNTARYQANAFIMSPGAMTVLPTGRVSIIGTAFYGEIPIESVDITFNDGDTWLPCEITYQPADSEVSPDGHIWTIWQYNWEPPAVGDYVMRMRARAVDGTTTQDDPAGTDRLEGYNAGMEIMVSVT